VSAPRQNIFFALPNINSILWPLSLKLCVTKYMLFFFYKINPITLMSHYIFCFQLNKNKFTITQNQYYFICYFAPRGNCLCCPSGNYATGSGASSTRSWLWTLNNLGKLLFQTHIFIPITYYNHKNRQNNKTILSLEQLFIK